MLTLGQLREFLAAANSEPDDTPVMVSSLRNIGYKPATEITLDAVFQRLDVDSVYSNESNRMRGVNYAKRSRKVFIIE